MLGLGGMMYEVNISEPPQRDRLSWDFLAITTHCVPASLIDRDRIFKKRMVPIVSEKSAYAVASSEPVCSLH